MSTVASDRALDENGGLVGATETLAALAAALWARAEGRALEPRLAEGIDRVLQAVGAGPVHDTPQERAAILAASIRSALVRAAEFAADPAKPPEWRHDDRALLIDQGTMSSALVDVLADSVIPGLDDLARRLERPGAAFLDVGTGVGGISIGACARWSELRAVGLDPWPPAHELARQRVEAAGLANRVELRLERVEVLADRDRYDLAWIAASFLRESALAAAIARVARALRPGGWMLLGLYRGDGELGEALAALRTLREGGDPVDAAQVTRLMGRSGLADVQVVAPPEWLSGCVLAGRKP